MKIINIDLRKTSKEEMDFIAGQFLSGKVVVYPTDTVYGLGCIATNKKAIDKIKHIKKRDKEKPFLFLVKSFCMAKKYAKISKKQDNYLRTIWPSIKASKKILSEAQNNPKTIIFDSRGLLPGSIDSEMKSIALRLPKSDFLSTMLKKIDFPIVSTSLNLSGEKTIEDLDDIEKVFKKIKPDLIINAGRLESKKPSSIIDIRDINNIKKIR